MSFWSAFPFIRITLAFIGGIVIAYYELLDSLFAIVGLCLLLLTYLAIILTLPRPLYYLWNPYIGLLALSSICLLGYFCLWSHQAHHGPHPITQQAKDIKAYVATAQADMQVKEKYGSVIVSLTKAHIQGKWQPMHGKVQLYVRKPFVSLIYQGDVCVVLGQPQDIPGPLNPQAFDWKTYLRHQNIDYQQFVQPNTLTKIAHAPSNYLQATLTAIRQYSKSSLAHHIHGSQEKGILLALVLGAKEDLDTMMQTAYATAGTMHVLAVSGLHVGILYWLLGALLGWLRKIRHMGWATAMLPLIGLWIYACITGLAPSVLRATVMFSMVGMAQVLHRKTNIYNALGASAFIVLLCDPYLLFAVGFQLSYLAVLGIVYLQPKLYCWLVFRNKLLNQVWLWTTVSLAAQLATAPLSCYYFHQFPTYFLVANWVVVPAAFCMLSLGLGVLATSWQQQISAYIAWVLEKITWLVNSFVAWISSLPYSLIKDIYLSITHLLLAYTLLLLLLIFLQRKKFYYLWMISICSFLWCISTTKMILSQQKQQGIIFYSIKPYSVVAFVKGMRSWIFVDDQLQDYDKKYVYHIQPSQLARGVHQSTAHYYAEATTNPTLPWKIWHGIKVGVFAHQTMIIIDKTSVPYLRTLEKINTDLLVVEDNAVGSLQPVLKSFAFKTLIIGASNKLPLSVQLKAEADQLPLKSHALQWQGAFIDF